MSTFTAAGGREPADDRAVALVRNDTTEPRSATVVLAAEGTTTRGTRLSPGEVVVDAAPADGAVTAAVHTADASASFAFDPATATAPPLFSLRDGRVLVSPE